MSQKKFSPKKKTVSSSIENKLDVVLDESQSPSDLAGTEFQWLSQEWPETLQRRPRGQADSNILAPRKEADFRQRVKNLSAKGMKV